MQQSRYDFLLLSYALVLVLGKISSHTDYLINVMESCCYLKLLIGWLSPDWPGLIISPYVNTLRHNQDNRSHAVICAMLILDWFDFGWSLFFHCTIWGNIHKRLWHWKCVTLHQWVNDLAGCLIVIKGVKQCTFHWMIPNDMVQIEMVLNRFIIHHLITITCISYEIIFTISLPKFINIAPL